VAPAALTMPRRADLYRPVEDGQIDGPAALTPAQMATSTKAILVRRPAPRHRQSDLPRATSTRAAFASPPPRDKATFTGTDGLCLTQALGVAGKIEGWQGNLPRPVQSTEGNFRDEIWQNGSGQDHLSRRIKPNEGSMGRWPSSKGRRPSDLSPTASPMRAGSKMPA